jgi:hypothetical protein
MAQQDDKLAWKSAAAADVNDELLRTVGVQIMPAGVNTVKKQLSEDGAVGSGPEAWTKLDAYAQLVLFVACLCRVGLLLPLIPLVPVAVQEGKPRLAFRY